jgi:hypothetical protein
MRRRWTEVGGWRARSSPTELSSRSEDLDIGSRLICRLCILREPREIFQVYFSPSFRNLQDMDLDMVIHIAGQKIVKA